MTHQYLLINGEEYAVLSIGSFHDGSSKGEFVSTVKGVYKFYNGAPFVIREITQADRQRIRELQARIQESRTPKPLKEIL